MYRIDDETATSSMPSPERAGTEGFFTEGNPMTGTVATSVRASWLNMVQEELRNIVLAGGITPSKDSNTQVLEALLAKFSRRVTVAYGKPDELVAIFTPPIKQLTDGMSVLIRAAHSNNSASVTFRADEIEAKPVVKGNDLPLVEADIAGEGHWLELQYDAKLDKWVLQNPARGIAVNAGGVPVGTIEYFAMQTPPPGYLKCDGAAVGRTTYPGLFDAIGTTFGTGDGIHTFNLPDLRGEFVRGWDDGRGVDAGREFGSGQGDAIRNISGNASTAFHITAPTQGAFNEFTGAFYYGNGAIRSYLQVIAASGTHPCGVYFDASRVVPTANENRPHNIALLACIKAFDIAANPELIDITQFANEMTSKADRAELTVSTILYPSGGTAVSPANVSANQQYVMDNPYTGYYVHCEAQIWGYSGWFTDNNTSYGTTAYQLLPDDSVVLKTGNNYVSTNQGGSPIPNIPALSTAPCRVIVTRLGKIQ